jgi:transcription elongation factor Elf1
MFEKVTGPECPECGCEDTIVTREPDATAIGHWFDTGEAKCTYCRSFFRFKAPPPQEQEPELEIPPQPEFVVYRLVRCPDCGSAKTVITSTRRPIRWHKCKSCGKPFRSQEEGV